MYYATPGSQLFNEISIMLHENNAMFRDTVILPDNTYTHVNSGSRPWLNMFMAGSHCNVLCTVRVYC